MIRPDSRRVGVYSASFSSSRTNWLDSILVQAKLAMANATTGRNRPKGFGVVYPSNIVPSLKRFEQVCVISTGGIIRRFSEPNRRQYLRMSVPFFVDLQSFGQLWLRQVNNFQAMLIAKLTRKGFRDDMCSRQNNSLKFTDIGRDLLLKISPQTFDMVGYRHGPRREFAHCLPNCVRLGDSPTRVVPGTKWP